MWRSHFRRRLSSQAATEGIEEQWGDHPVIEEQSCITLAVGAPLPPALLGGRLRASLSHPGAFQQELVA